MDKIKAKVERQKSFIEADTKKQQEYLKQKAEVSARAESLKQDGIRSTAQLNARRGGVGTQSAQITPGMGRNKQVWESNKSPQMNEVFREQLKAHGHSVPEASVQQAQQTRDFLSETQQAGAALRKAGVKSDDYSRDEYEKSAQNLNKHLDQNKRGWNVNTDIEQTRKTGQNNHNQQKTQTRNQNAPSMER